jgi:hypothetical protein
MHLPNALEAKTLAQIPAPHMHSGGKPKRPLILTIVVLLLLVRAIYLASVMAATILFLFAGQGSGMLLQIPELLLTILMFVIALLLLAAAIGLWLMRPMAWTLNMIIMGFLLIVGLWIHFTDQAGLVNDAGILLNVLIVFYLVQPDVRALFVSRPADT